MSEGPASKRRRAAAAYKASAEPDPPPPAAAPRKHKGQQQQQQQQGAASKSAKDDPYDVALEDAFLTSHLPFKLKQSVFSSGPKKVHWKRAKQILATEAELPSQPGRPSYLAIEAPPSVYPPKRYCDLTGEAAKYVDPKTGLRYAAAEQYAVIRSLPDDVVQAHLAVRNAHVVLK